MKNRSIYRTVLSLAIFLMTTIGFAQGESSEAAKRLLYHQVMKDPNIAQLVDQITRDPGDRTKLDSLLIQLPLSPLDLFQIRMELAFREYLIPREVQQLHLRWLQFHVPGPVSAANTFPLVNALMDLNPSLNAPTIGTNRNVATTDSPAPEDFQGEIQVALNRNNTNQLVAGANTWDTPSGCDQTQAAFGTTDGGVTWNYTCVPSVGGYGLSCPNQNDLKFGSDPALYWDNNNNAFFNYMLLCCGVTCQFGFSNPTSSLVVAKSTDSGSTWTGHGVIVNHLSSTNGGFDDKQFYVIDNTPTSPFYGRHYQCWDNNNNELFAYSTTNGTSWTQVNLPPPPIAGLFDLGCEMAVQSNGTIHLVWDALTCPGSTCSGESTYYTRSTNGGANWSAPVLVKSHNVFGFNNNAKIPAQNNRGINPFGAIDVDNSTAFPGRLYFAYSDVNSGASMATSDIYVARSLDDGVNWTHVKVNDDATNTAQFHPFLAVDQTNGSVVVGWHDARNDTANNRKIDYYITRSTDGGVTWEPNAKVSAPSSEFNNSGISYSDENTTENTGYNPNQYGEYLGLDAHAGKAYMAWTDTRHYFPNNTSNTQRENLGFAVITYDDGNDTIAPITSITQPVNNAIVNGTINVNADASDNVGVTKVEFYVDGGLINTDNSFPYSVSWNTTTVTNGSHALTSKAYDAANNTGTSLPVNVTVNNPDSIPPTTSITSPTAGADVSGTIPVTANASDNVGIKKVDFFVDGNVKIGSDLSSPYQANWNTNVVPNGNHNLTSKAFDTANNSATSAAVSVNVNNPTNCAVSNQLIMNPGFESGNNGWGRSSSNGNTTGMITNSVSFSPHSGSWYAKLDGFGTTTTQTIMTNSSTMVIPAESCAASLTFWLSIGTDETSTANDTLKVQIQTKNNNGTFGSWTTLATFSNLDSTGINVYVQHTISMLPYAGKTAKIRFQASENSSLQTTFLIDDVNLNVTQ